MSTRIDEVLSATKQQSKTLSGTEIAHGGALAQSTTFTIQAVPQADGDWEVVLEGGITPFDGRPAQMDLIAEFDQDSEQLIVTLPLSLGVQYRFRHASGVAVACRLAV